MVHNQVISIGGPSRCRRRSSRHDAPRTPAMRNRCDQQSIASGRQRSQWALLIVSFVLGTISVAPSSAAGARSAFSAPWLASHRLAAQAQSNSHFRSLESRGSPSQTQPYTRSTTYRRQSQGAPPVARGVPPLGVASVAASPYRSRNGTFCEAPVDCSFTSITASTAQGSPLIQQSTRVRPTRFHVYCDLDGVLVDFERGIRALFPDLPAGVSLQDLDRSLMWKRVAQADAFFQNLPWTQSGPQLWKALQPLQPDILTGVPALHPSSRREKYLWCLRELQRHRHPDARDGPIRLKHVDSAGRFGTHTPSKGSLSSPLRIDEGVTRVITCWSSNKHYESRPGAVLIDDQEWLRHDWEAKGGIFIHHSPNNVEATLEQLRRHHVLPPIDDEPSGGTYDPAHASTFRHWRSLKP